MKVKLLAITQDSERLIEQAGRICYDSKMNAETRGQFIRKRIEQGHESILECSTATFLVEGVSRALLSQITRHRLASFSVQSLRYCKVDELRTVIPESIQNNNECLNAYYNAIANIEEAYRTFIDNGIKPGDARSILPLSTETKFIMSANFRELRHIIKIRTDKHAQREIRELMNEIKIILQEACPNCFEDL